MVCTTFYTPDLPLPSYVTFHATREREEKDREGKKLLGIQHARLPQSSLDPLSFHDASTCYGEPKP